MKRMLVIDNSASVRESLRIIFKDAFHVETTDPWQDILTMLTEETFDLVIMGLGGKVGQEIDLLRDIASHDPTLPLLALVEQDQRETLEAISAPYIADLVVKPFNVYELREKVKSLQKKTSLSPHARSPLKMRHIFQQQKIYFSTFVRHKLSEVTIKTKQSSQIPVLLQGEKGTGKEIAAKWLHFRGPDLNRSFLKLTASGLMEEALMQSFLIKEKGLFRPKNLGTVYLEGIESLRPEVQEKLMEILEEGSVVTPEGREVAMNFRIIASSLRDLRELVYKKVLKEELLYQLNIIDIYLPPLRERREEIAGIAQQILEASAQRFSLRVKEFAPDALETLKNYYWPGNVRELESVLVRSLIFSPNEMLSQQDLRFGMEERALDQESEEEERADRKPVMKVVKPEQHREMEKESPSHKRGESVFKELVTELAHEIKNPLVAIKTFTQLLPERFDDQEFREQFYRTTGDSVDRIDQLVEKILSSARFSRPKLTQVNLHDLIEESLARHAESFRKRQIVFQKALKSNLPLILTDEEQLRYVLSNVLSTITHFIPERSEVSFSTQTVSLNPEEKGRLPLEHVPNGSVVEMNVSYPGGHDRDGMSGRYSIELFLAQQLVERYLGLMAVHSSAEKTAITIKLPVATGGKS